MFTSKFFSIYFFVKGAWLSFLRLLKQLYGPEDVGGKQIIPATCVHWGITPSKKPLPSFLPSPLLNLQTAQVPLVR